MTIDRNDPRWTAYILDELGTEERARFEAEMSGEPDSEAILGEIREATVLLRRSFASQEAAGLTHAERQSVLDALPAASASARDGRGRISRWSIAGGVAASLLVGIVTLHVVRDIPDPARTTAGLTIDTPRTPEPPPATLTDAADRGAPTTDQESAVVSAPTSGAVPGSARGERERDDLGQTGSDDVGLKSVLAGLPGGTRESGSTDEARQNASLDVAGTAAQTGEASDIGPTAPQTREELPAFRQDVLDPVTGGGAGAIGQLANSFARAGAAAPPPPPGPPPAPGAFAAIGATAPAPPAPGVSPPDRRRPAFSTEEYDRITDNPFRLVSDEPLATFSVDVDTASYANVRRFLDQRTLPPADAVRIEEMVNYFTYDYAPPRDGRPVRVNAEVAGAPWAPAHRLVRIGIQGREIERGGERASNLVFLIDVSGSMSDANKLPLLVDGMKLLVDQLGENDRVAIAVYAGASGLVLDSTPGFRRERILSALDRLQAGGSTNGGAGIRLAYDVAVANFIDGGINRVILATDGDFNVGVTNNGDLSRLIEEEAGTGVFLSVLGFGTGNYNDAGLEGLADQGNGNYAYIDSIREARKVLVEEIGGTLITIAKDVKFQVEFNPSEVTAYRLIGYENRVLGNQDFNDDTVDAGEIGAGHTVTALFEIVPRGAGFDAGDVDPLRYQAPLAATDRGASGELLTVKVRYKEPDGDTSQLIEAPLVDRGRTFEDASTDFRFASAVAGFGMILRDSPYRGSASLNSIVRIGEASQGSDEGGYRHEFVELVRRARAIVDPGR